MKVLVTGCCGFIGGHLAETLLLAGNNVVGIDNFSGNYSPAEYRENLSILKKFPGFEFIKASVENKTIFKKLKNRKITHIVHLAAKTGVRPSVEHPADYVNANTVGTLNVLNFAAPEKIPFVFASTSSVYGKNKIPFREDMQTNTPLSPYAASKIGAEALAYSYHHLYGIPVNVLRFFTVYGPRGRRDMAVYLFAKAISQGMPITIFGDGKQKRDFTYVSDIVDGILLSMKAGGYNTFNLGCSKTEGLDRLIALLEKNLGKKAIRKHIPAKPEDVVETYADISKAKKELGYAPKAGLEHGIEEFCTWFCTQKKD